ncbi:probable G-protein coupled receptor AH9.1 [Trichonephila clavata]|uniref:Probable G-protein coupled receptor AH9.1 n=1 Tax=Trichonephila clavata TaxID=2740835 RepID=A0A8X6HIS5_TRICU|nr:probable G-protein coupled receptor AH9.1 [Trichonephila clavata]
MTEFLISDMNYSRMNSTFATNFSQQTSDEKIKNLKFIAYGIIGSIIIGLGVLGNLINLFVLTRPSLKGVTFVYLTWLAISDLMSLLVSASSLPRFLGIQPKTYLAAVYYAHGEIPLVNAFMASSIFIVVALSVDRYFSVCLPTRFKEVHNIQRARRSITAAYICAFTLYVPICFQKCVVPFNFNKTVEYGVYDNLNVVDHTAYRIYLLVKEIIVRLGPALLLTIFNITIIMTLQKTLTKRQDRLGISSTGSLPSNMRCREKQRLCTLLAGITVLFIISMVPAAILTLLNSDDEEFHFGFQLFRAFANIMELSNYAMNFYLYCTCSSEIRKTFTSLVATHILNESSPSSKPSVLSNSKF